MGMVDVTAPFGLSPEVTLVRTLLYNPALAALGPDDRQRLGRRATRKNLRPDQNLVLAGEPDTPVHLVTEGFFKLMAFTGGRERVVDFAGSGDLIGEIEALLDIPADLDAVATTDAEVLAIPREIFLESIGTGAASELARVVAERLHATRRNMTGAPVRSAVERIAGRLLQLTEAVGRVNGGTMELEMPLDQTEIGQLAGASRESACRAINGFKREGLVEMRGRTVRVLRPDLLEKLSCGELGARPCR